MGKYGQVFSVQLPAAPDEVRPALKRAVDDMDGAVLGSVNDDERRLQFATGVTLTSWGEQIDATVVASGDGSSEVRLSGKPKGTFLTTKLGEKMQVSTIDCRLRHALDNQLIGGVT